MNKEIIEIDYSEYLGRGNEDVKNDDFSTSYIKILEKMSPTVDEVEGAKAGDIYMSLTNTVVESLYFVPLHYITIYTVWGNDSAEPILGTFKEEIDAYTYANSRSSAEVVKTGRNVYLILNESSEIDHLALMHLTKTKLKAHNSFNTLLEKEYKAFSKKNNLPRYTGIWKLSTVKTEKDGKSWYLPIYQFIQPCHKSLLDEANRIYLKMKDSMEETTFQKPVRQDMEKIAHQELIS